MLEAYFSFIASFNNFTIELHTPNLCFCQSIFLGKGKQNYVKYFFDSYCWTHSYMVSAFEYVDFAQCNQREETHCLSSLSHFLSSLVLHNRLINHTPEQCSGSKQQQVKEGQRRYRMKENGSERKDKQLPHILFGRRSPPFISFFFLEPGATLF